MAILSTLYTTLPLNLTKEKINELVDQTFNREGSLYLILSTLYTTLLFSSEQPKRFKIVVMSELSMTLSIIF